MLNATNLIEMKVKYSRFRHNAKETSFTSPTGPRRQGGEREHAQYPTNDDVTSGWSCRRPEKVSILSFLIRDCRELTLCQATAQHVSGLRDKFCFLTSFIYLYLQREYSWLLFIEKQVYICNMSSLIYYVTSVKIFQQVLYILLQVSIVYYNLYTKTEMFYS